MQKKLIALAIAAAISAPAFADTSNVTVYGTVDVSYDSIATGTSAAGVAGARNNAVSGNSTRVGLKGSEDLGSGLSAIWQVESLVNVGNGGSAGTGIGGRDTFAGLSSTDAGTVLLGRHDTPYKMATRAADVFTDGIADNRAIMGGGSKVAATFDGRQDEVVAYVSPKIGGMFTGILAHVNLKPVNTLATDGKGSANSVAGLFDFGSGFTGSVAYEDHMLDYVMSGAKEDASKLGLSYAQDAFVANLVVEKTDDNLTAVTAANKNGHTNYYLSGKYMLTASDALKAAYTHAGEINGVTGSDSKQFSLGYDHLLSKRTTVYALYTKLSNGSVATYALGSGESQVAPSAASAAGASPSAFALGLRHTF